MKIRERIGFGTIVVVFACRQRKFVGRSVSREVFATEKTPVFIRRQRINCAWFSRVFYERVRVAFRFAPPLDTSLPGRALETAYDFSVVVRYTSRVVLRNYRRYRANVKSRFFAGLTRPSAISRRRPFDVANPSKRVDIEFRGYVFGFFFFLLFFRDTLYNSAVFSTTHSRPCE